ncbi:polysaccharide deacetylase family protein [Geothrix sp. PMB-07]|uniref:polysaccharide deacetylase family protein n=1 Tax=Geothrix sp. PMB-07 TaxID=3068640 RepID=UPI00274138C0|nr:polysaccharide deacetylase family protein [Geothrix sp. PMB-07]WLT31993.1 polysaccharide deacetylase family protein [Geothrix sp. PMB-07]
MRLGPAALLLLTVLACGRKEPQEAALPEQSASLPVTSAWSWHPLGGLVVIEGEVGEPTELVLEGRSIKERRAAEPGPVRWELFRPPEGEEAVLRTLDGRELARFTFSKAAPRRAEPPTRLARQTPTEPPASKARPEAQLRGGTLPPLPERKPVKVPELAQVPEAADTKPRPQSWLQRLFSRPEPAAETAKTRAEARLKSTPVPAIPERSASSIPTAGTIPAAEPIRSAAFVPVTPDLEPPPSAKPATPPASLVTPLAIPPKGPALWPGMGEGLNLTRGPGGHKRILLSFDGGSSAEVATEVLDLLKARGVHTTLFLTGAFIHRFPALVKRMAAEGHELGNHTMNHPHFAPGMKRDPKWTKERIQRELLDADAALVKLLGRPMDPFWRAPYGEHTAEIRKWAEELGYRHVGWSEGADTLDWATPKDRRLYRSGDAIVQRLQQRLNRDGDGIIVLMHLGSARAMGDRPTDGLGAFMDRARQEGWTFVSAGTFLHDLGKPAWDPHQRLSLLSGSAAAAR